MRAHRIELPNRETALAFATLGHKIEPEVYRSEARAEHYPAWFCADKTAEAGRILQAAGRPVTDQQRLSHAEPDHPFLVCLAVQANHAALLAWLNAPQCIPQCAPGARGARVCRLMDYAPANAPHDLIQLRSASALPPHMVNSLPHAAALITCGFIPWPRWTTFEGLPALFFREESDTFGGLFLADLMRARGDSVVQGMTAGEHPWCYALQCMLNDANFRKLESQAARNPIFMLKQKRGPRTAIVSRRFVDEGKAFDRERNLIFQHLA